MEITGKSVISVNGMIKLVIRLKDLEYLMIIDENKLSYAKGQAKVVQNNSIMDYKQTLVDKHNKMLMIQE